MERLDTCAQHRRCCLVLVWCGVVWCGAVWLLLLLLLLVACVRVCVCLFVCLVVCLCVLVGWVGGSGEEERKSRECDLFYTEQNRKHGYSTQNNKIVNTNAHSKSYYTKCPKLTD